MDYFDDFKDHYRETLDSRGVRQKQEATALQIAQASVSNMLGQTPYYLGVHHVPNSLVRDDVMGWLADKMNYVCIPKGSVHDGSHKDELSEIVKQVAIIIDSEEDKRKLKAAFTIIRDQAEEALEDMV